MFATIKRLISSRRRSFDAAAGGRRWADAKAIDSLNAAILASATVSARRAGYYARNNPWVASGINSLVGNAVGCGIKPRSRHPDPDVRARLHMLWERWTDRADVAGLCDHYGQQGLAVRSMVEGGESFARLRVDDLAGPDDVPLIVELLDREQVPLDRFTDLTAGTRVRAGIEFAESGRRVAYHALRQRPGDPFAPLVGNALETVRIPAADFVHLFQPLAAGQLRGISWLAPVLLRIAELDQFEDAALVKAKVAALFTGFIRDPDGTAAGQAAGGTVTNDILQLGLEPGTLVPLPPGADISFSNPAESKDYVAFVKGHIQAIAAGIGVPYECVSGDLAGVTYSSIRAGLVEYRRRLEQLQHNVIVFQFCRPVWERFVRLAVLSGALAVRDFDSNPTAYLACDWLPPKFDYVDPLKDVRAEVEANKAGLKPRSQSIAERGLDAETVDAVIAADNARATTLGLAFSTSTAAAPAESSDPNE